MPNIKRKVDIVSVQINSLSGGVTPTFNQLLSCIEANEYYVNGKLFELSMLDSEVQGVVMAFIETTQDSDLPPVKNKQSKELTNNSYSIIVTTRSSAFSTNTTTTARPT